MALILAIEPDPGQSTRLDALVRRRLSAQLVQAPTTEGALAALATIGDRVPDLVLVPSLLSPEEDAAIAGALRLIAAAAKVRMLTTPLLADPEPPRTHRGVFARLRGRKAQSAPGGCSPDVFADQIAAYLAEAASERNAAREDLLDELAGAADAPPDAAAGPEAVTQPTQITAASDPEIAAPATLVMPVVVVQASEILEPASVVMAPALLETESLVAEPVPTAYVEEAPVAPAPVPKLKTARVEPAVDIDALIAPLLFQIASQRTPVEAAIAERSPVVASAMPVSDAETMAHDVIASAFMSEASVPSPLAAPVASSIGDEIAVPELVIEAASHPAIVTAAARAIEDEVTVSAFVSEAAALPVLVAAATPTVDHVDSVSAVAMEAASHPVIAVAATSIEDAAAVAELVNEAVAHAVVAAVTPSVEDAVPSPVVVNEVSYPAQVADADRRVEVEITAPAAMSEVPAHAAGAVSSQARWQSDDADPMFFAEAPSAPAAGQPERSRWNELVESLRQDIQRLKTERGDGTEAPPAAAAAPPQIATGPVSVVARRTPPARRAPVVPITSATSAHKPAASRVTPRRPTVDQWGLFDPEQCGFAALLAKLDELDSREDVPA